MVPRRTKPETNAIEIMRLKKQVAALEAAGSGGGTGPQYFLATRTDGGALVTTTTNPPTASTAVNWNNQPIVNSGFSYDTGLDEVTIESDANGMTGLFNIQINGDGFNNRTQVVIELQQDTGSGFNTIIRSSNYNSRDSDQNEGATHISGFLVTLSEGDKFRVMCANNNDGVVGIYGTNGCFWSIKAQ